MSGAGMARATGSRRRREPQAGDPRAGSCAARPAAAPWGALRRGAGRRWTAAFVAAALATSAGCHATWTPKTDAPPAPLQWPYAPAPAKVRYGWALTGIARDRDASTVLGSVLFGRAGGSGDFALPVAVATGSDGRLAVADRGCACVHLYLPDSAKALRLAGSGDERLVSPVGLAFDDANRLYVTDSAGALWSFDEQGAGRFVVREAAGAALGRPTGIVWAPDRRVLHVVDTTAHAVRTFDTDGRAGASFGRRGAGAGELNFPTYIARSPAGELFVTDTMNFRVAIFDADGKPVGSFGRHGDGSGDFAMPKGIAVDADGVVYVVDALFDNVQLFNRNGEFLLTLGSRGTGFGEFWLPSGAYLADQGRLYVCDTYNRRVQVFGIESEYESERS